MSDQKLSEDLAWLRDNAFECMVTFNTHRINGVTVAEEVAAGQLDEEDWIDPQAKAEAIEKNQLATVHVYPCGSVASYLLAGVDLGPLVARARELCAAELDRWHRTGQVPIHQRAAT